MTSKDIAGNATSSWTKKKCPFYPTSEDTMWKEELDCDQFWD